MHGRKLIGALSLGVTLWCSALTPAHAAFDVDGRRETAIHPASLVLRLRETFSANLIRLAGYGDQCTAYALDRMHDATGQWMAVRGNAFEWANEAQRAGWTVSERPMASSVVVMPPAPGYKYTIYEPQYGQYETPMHSDGHVGWVEAVDGDWILVKDQNWQRGRISERWVRVAGSPMRFIYSRG